MTRFALFAVINLATISGSFAQQADSGKVDLVELFVKKKARVAADQYRSQKKVHFSLLPAAVSVPGGGRAVITAVNAAFYLGDEAGTNLSNVYIIPYTNLSNRYGLYLRPNLWLPKNTINILGDYRIAHFPQYSWGLGGDSPEWDRSLIDSDYFRFYQKILTKIYRHWYVGPGYDLDSYYNIEETEYVGEGHLDRYEDTPATTSVSSGFTLNLLHDARVNAINPSSGAYLLISYRYNDTALGSSFTNSSLFIDGRKYIKLHKTRDNILAFHSYYWTVLNGETPYLALPSTSWAPVAGAITRGFQSGRYRSNALLYFEGEQRYQLTDNGLIGVVGFMNISSVSEFDTQHFKYWQVGAGFGLRAKFNKYSNTNIAIDMGFSQNYWGVWLSIGEVF